MANRTVKDAQTIKGTNPQYLVEKIIRSRIYDCKYWKEECFALTCKFHLKNSSNCNIQKLNCAKSSRFDELFSCCSFDFKKRITETSNLSIDQSWQ